MIQIKSFRLQRGNILFIATGILLILSVLALLSANSSIAESKRVTGERNADLARLNAESAIAEAKIRVADIAVAQGADHVCEHMVCFVASNTSSRDTLAGGTANNAIQISRLAMNDAGASDDGVKSSPPTYIVEDAGTSTSDDHRRIHLFRITSRGTGPSSDARNIGEAMYAIPE